VLAAFIQTLGLQHVHVGGLSWGAGLALELYRRYPTMVRSLILMGAYAGWTGSLPAATVEQRLQLMERNSRLPPEDWAPALIRTLVADDAREETRNELASPSVRRSGRRSGRVGSILHLRPDDRQLAAAEAAEAAEAADSRPRCQGMEDRNARVELRTDRDGGATLLRREHPRAAEATDHVPLRSVPLKRDLLVGDVLRERERPADPQARQASLRSGTSYPRPPGSARGP
jgi:pimeloyl-ACP methyl ester carboxylesterase